MGQYLVDCDYYWYEYYNGYTLSETMGKIPGASEIKSKKGILGIGGFGIVVPSKVKLDLNGSVLKQIDDAYLNTTYASRNDKSKFVSDNASNQYEIFRIENGENITITNGVLIGDKAERSTTNGGERGTGIYVRTSGNIDTVNINNMIIKYMSGDGIDIDGVASEENNTFMNTGINIENNYIYACNRQGISLEHGKNFTIQNNVIYNIIGTDPSDCIDVEPLPNYKGQWRGSTRYPSQYNPFNYSWSYVDNIVIKGNIFNSFTTLSLRYYVGDIDISDNKIYGRITFNNSDGYIKFTKNKVYSTPNNAHQNVVSNRAVIVGGKTNIRDDNDGAGYRTNGLGNKDCPEAVLMYENEFYNDFIVWEKVSFADVAYNKFYTENSTANLRIRFEESDKSFKNVYIHDNSFDNTRENVYWKVSDFNINPIVNAYNNTYLNNLNDTNSGLAANISINSNASDDLSNIIESNKKVDYFKLIKPSNKQIYWVGESSPYNSAIFNPEGMEIGAYKLEKDQDGEYTKVKVTEVKSIDVGQVLSNVSSSANISINGEDYTIYLDNDDTDDDNPNPLVLSNTTMSRIVLVGENKTYSVYQKLRVRTAVKEGNTFGNGTKGVKNVSYINPVRRSSYDKTAFNIFTFGKNINIGDNISQKLNVYSVFYNIDPNLVQTSSYYLTDSGTANSRYGYAKPSMVPPEFVTWSIIKPNGEKKVGNKATIIESEDFNSEGKVEIQADYLGIKLTAIVEGYKTDSDVEPKEDEKDTEEEKPSQPSISPELDDDLPVEKNVSVNPKTGFNILYLLFFMAILSLIVFVLYYKKYRNHE